MLHHKIHKWENLLCMTGVSINQGCDSEASPAYLGVLHCVLCVGYLFHVSTSDSFDMNSSQVDLVIEGVIKGLFLGCTSIRVPPPLGKLEGRVGGWAPNRQQKPVSGPAQQRQSTTVRNPLLPKW